MYSELIKSIEEFLNIVKTRVISGSDIKIIDFWVWNTQPEKTKRNNLSFNPISPKESDLMREIQNLTIKEVTEDFWKHYVLLCFLQEIKESC